MSQQPTQFKEVINERSTAIYTVTLQDEKGAAIPASAIGSLKLTLFEVCSGNIVNGRNGQNVLNANNVSVDANGLLTWNIQADDGEILGSEPYETHRAEFDCEFNGGASRSTWDVDLVYRNLTKLTA